MECLSPMDYHRYPLISKVTSSDKYFFAIIVLRNNFGNKPEGNAAFHLTHCNS